MVVVASSEPNHWVRRAVVGWSIFLGVFGAWGWLASIGWSMAALMHAGVSLSSCVLLLNASAQMRRAWAKRRIPAMALWGVATVAFGAWSGVSAHHAFEVSQQTAPGETGSAYGLFAMIFFLVTSWLDPLLMWGVEDVEKSEAPKAARHGEGLPEDWLHPVGAAGSGERSAGRFAVVAGGLAAGAATVATASASERPTFCQAGADYQSAMAKAAAEQAELANRVPGDFRWEAASMDEREQRALQLLADATANGGRGWSMRAIERQTGVTRYKVAKLAAAAGLVRHRVAMTG
jgi:hypothetical protein